MNLRRRELVFLLFIGGCHVVGLLLFCKGFLLKRVVIPQYSQCAHITAANDHHFQPCCNEYPRKFKRVVWLLVDALRYDFVTFDETLPNPVPVYRNKLPFVRDLLRDKPRNAKLFRCVADPPTTTMQRLKAITTGSLPTFIDFSSNFNSYEILEDSLPYQAKANGRNVTFMGDDTWLGLYPNMLSKVFDYPSLNVQDLDTVDNGVMAHLIPELEKYDAEFVVGHFLGVDHVGHTYGPSHPSMETKLTQMNEILKSVLAAVDNDTIVFVFGDHGMTSTGDHGGETELETNAALLVYTPRPIFDPKQPSGRSLSQIDLVPTVALSLGMPIPFSSLGMVIPEVILPFDKIYDQTRDYTTAHSNGYDGRVTLEFLTALRINAEQVHTYLKTYVQYSDDFPANVYRSLEQKLEHAQEYHKEILIGRGNEEDIQNDLTATATLYVDYIRSVKAMCQSVWAKFDSVPIMKGLFLIVLTTCVSFVALLDLSFRSFLAAATVGFSIGTIVGLASTLVTPSQLELNLIGVLSLVTSVFFCSMCLPALLYLWKMKRELFSRAKSLLSPLSISNMSLLQIVTMTIMFYGISLVSNSFVIYEGDTIVFLLQSMVVCFMFNRLKRLFPMGKRTPRQHSVTIPQIIKSASPFVLLMVCIRATKLFYTCRDLQVGCEATSFTLALPSAVGPLSKLRFIASCLGVCLVPISLVVFLSNNTHSRYLNLWVVRALRYGLPIASLCVCGHWALLAQPQSTLDSLPHWQHVLLPRVVYCISGFTIALCVLQPFRKQSTVIVHEARAPPPFDSTKEHNASLTRETMMSCRTPAIATYEFARHRITPLPLMVVLVAAWIPVAMLLNDAIALSAIIMVIQVVLFIIALEKSEEGTSWPVTVFWSLMCCQYFFGFGHQATLTSLRIEAAFVGVHGEITGINAPLAAIFVGLNTLASQILFGLGLPLVLLLEGPWHKKNSHSLIVVMLQYIAFHSLKVIVSAVAAYLHRRHLMIWGVFSPRFLYEGAFQVTSDICVIMVYLLITKLENQALY